MRTLTLVVVLLVAVGVSAAGDLEEATFGARLSLAITRFPRYADLAGFGGASAGSPWSSSANPSSQAMRPSVGESGLGSSVQYAALLTEEGTNVHVGSWSMAIDAGDWGVFQPALLILESNRASMNDGLDFEWEGWSAEVQWAKRIDDDTSVGLNLSILASEMNFHLDSIHISKAVSETYQIRVGVLHAFAERFYAGVDLEFAFAPSRTKLFDFMRLGTGTIRDDDVSSQVVFRPGIYTFLTDDLTLYADYQFAAYRDDSGPLSIHRLYVGLDQTVIEGLYLRAGGVVDDEGNASLAVGIGLAPCETIYIDIAYEYDMFPELEPEFGRADLFGIGLTVLF